MCRSMIRVGSARAPGRACRLMKHCRPSGQVLVGSSQTWSTAKVGASPRDEAVVHGVGLARGAQQVDVEI